MRKLFTLLAAIVLLCGQLAAQNNRTVKGKVTDDKGLPLSGVTVSAVGTNRKVATDKDGNFAIEISNTVRALQFSYVGFALQEVPVSDNPTVDVQISLKAEDASLTEVVVTSFGIVRDKKTLGYDVTTISGAELNRGQTPNLTNALAAKIPGVRVQGSGGSFSGSSIIIRGYNSFTGSNQPLFVVDGMPIDNGGGGNALQNGPANSNRAIDINPEDIETMTVLKGPSAAALYGSRAANGVILITTKKGKSGQRNITLSSSYQVENVNRFPEYQNRYAQGLGGVFNGLTNASWGPEITGQTVLAYNPATNAFDRSEQLAAYPDNVRDMFQTGTTMNHNLSFSGGAEKNTFRFAYGYTRSEGVIPNNLLNRHNFTINTSSKITSKLTATISATYANNSSKRTQQGNQLSNPLFRGWFTPRSYNLTGLAFEDAVGNQRYPLGEDHPYWTIKHNRYNDEINRIYGNVGFNYKIASWLQADYKIGADVFSNFRHGYDQVGARGGANTTANAAGGILENRNQFRSYNSNFYLTANKRFSDFNVTAILGNEIAQRKVNNTQVIGRGIIVRDFEQVKNTTTIATPVIGSSLYRLMGVYGDVAVGYKSIATVNATLRSDWSSIFTEGNRQFYYPSVSLAFNVTELFPELKNNVVDNIKLRGNISKVGKGTEDFIYSTESYFVAGGSADGFGPTISYPFNGLQSFTLSNGAGNSSLQPEFNTNSEIGLDLSFFKSRLTVDFTLYKQKSTNLIFGVPNSGAAGVTSVVKNAGDMSTKGIELAISGTPVKSRSVEWNISAQFTQFKSIVDRLAPGVSVITLAGFVTPNVRLVEGDEYGQIYGNAYQRDAKSGKIIVGANGLPLITPGVQKIGNPNPKFLVGVTNTLTVKGVTLSFLIDYKKGGDQYSRNIADLQRNGATAETAEMARYDAAGVVTKPYLFDAVLADGTPNTTYVTAEQYWGNSGKYAAAEGFIYETTWLRLREASLSYSIPSNLLRKTPFGNAELGVFGRNLFLHAPNYPHLDPEQNALGVSSAQGLEFNALPQTRTMGVNLRLTF
jgi:TonB-linked SusC/RagA family outer membrane protein